MQGDEHETDETGPNGETTVGESLSRGEVKRRASAGVFVVASWGLANLLTAFFGNLVLARLLEPRDFGIVAVGMTVMVLAGAFADGGLANGIIRRAEAPTPSELRTLTGISMLLMIGIASIVAVVALQFGIVGQVTALMILALPISGFQGAGRAVLTRDLRLKAVSAVDAAGVFAFYAWAIPTVLLGAGLWGLASATVVRSLAGTIAVGVIPGAGLYRPSLERVREFGALLWFGARFQANWLVYVLREQGLNAVTGAIGGVHTLGIWSLATRLLLVPMLLYEALGRVTFPTMAHILGRGDDPAPLVERTARLAAVASTLLLPAFVASAPGVVPSLFGEQWAEVPEAFPGAALGLLIGGTVGSAAVGYLFAADRPGTVLAASVALAAAWLATAVALLPFLGVAALGIGWAVSAVAESIVLAPATRRMCGARVVRPLAYALPIAITAALAGWLITELGSATFWSGLAGGAVAFVLSAAGLSIFARVALIDLVQITRRSVLDALRRDRVSPVTEPA